MIFETITKFISEKISIEINQYNTSKSENTLESTRDLNIQTRPLISDHKRFNTCPN